MKLCHYFVLSFHLFSKNFISAVNHAIAERRTVCFDISQLGQCAIDIYYQSRLKLCK